MATSGSSAGAFGGRPAFNLRITVSRTAVSGTTSTWAVFADVMNPTGTSLSFFLNNSTVSVTVNGHTFTGTRNLDFRGGQASLRFINGPTFQVAQGGGTPVISWSASIGASGVFGSASTSGSFTADRIATAPAAPTITNITAITHNAATIAFTLGANGGATITATQVQISTTSNFAGTTTRTVTSSPVTWTGLAAGVRYFVRARSTNAAGWGPWSAVRDFTTATVPAAPTNLVPSQVAPTGWRITHTPGSSGGLAIVQTQFQRSFNAAFDGTFTVNVAGSATTAVFTGQEPGRTYFVRSRQQNAAGVGPWSATITVTTPQLVIEYRGANLLPPGLAGELLAGSTLTFSADVRTVTGGAGTFGIAAYQAGSSAPFEIGDELPIPAGSTERLALTFEVPAAGLSGLVVYLNATDVDFFATTFAISNLLLEQAEDAGDYFDGDTPDIWGPPDPEPGQTEPLPGEEQGGVVIRPAQSPNAIRIDSCEPLEDGVTFARDVGDVITRVTVRWLDYELDEEGQPGTTERSYTLVDVEGEAEFGSRGLSIGTLLVDQPSAQALAERILARVQGIHWRIEGLTLDDAVGGTFDDGDDGRERLMALLDAAARGGLPLYLTGLPAWAPAGPNLPIFLEGGRYVYDAGAWRLELTVSSATGQGQSGSYWDLDPAWRIWDVDPGIHTLDLRGVAGESGLAPSNAAAVVTTSAKEGTYVYG